jgi:hypothetical protein
MEGIWRNETGLTDSKRGRDREISVKRNNVHKKSKMPGKFSPPSLLLSWEHPMDASVEWESVCMEQYGLGENIWRNVRQEKEFITKA